MDCADWIYGAFALGLLLGGVCGILAARLERRTRWRRFAAIRPLGTSPLIAERVQVPVEMPDGGIGAIAYSRREFEEAFGRGGVDG